MSKEDELVLVSPFSMSAPKSRGCWSVFSSLVGGLWSTRQMVTARETNAVLTAKQKDLQRRIHVRTNIKELILYCCFILVLSFLALGESSATQYHYQQVMTSLFAKAKAVRDPQQLWEFLESDFLDSLFWQFHYNDGDVNNFICPGAERASAGPCIVAPIDKNILYENRLLGVARLRQLRVYNGSCEIHSNMRHLFENTCYAEYEQGLEDTEPFDNVVHVDHLVNNNFDTEESNDNNNEEEEEGTKEEEKFVRVVNLTSASAWTYRSASALGNVMYPGLLHTYSGGGYTQDLSSDRNQSLSILEELKENEWINRGTRFLTVDFTVYNANLNYFCIIKLAFEFPAAGGVVSSLDLRTVKLIRYVNPSDYFKLACELLLCCFVLYYVVEEIIEIRLNRIAYLANIWNILDLLVVLIAIMCIGLTAFSVLEIERTLSTLLSRPDHFSHFDVLAFSAELTLNAVALLVFFSWIKFFKYVHFNKTMIQLSKTLDEAWREVAGFGFMFFIAFMAFAHFGYIFFGPYILRFSTFTDAVFTLLRTILGDFDFPALKKADRILGPGYFLIYVLFVIFVLLNVFLAIINDTYAKVKAEVSSRKLAYDLGEYLRTGYVNLLHRISSHQGERLMHIEEAVKQISLELDGDMSYEEMRQNLKRMNFADLEIDMAFARYEALGTHDNLDDDDDPDNKWLQDEKRHRQKMKEAKEQDRQVSRWELANMAYRIDMAEASVKGIIMKLDGAVEKLDAMESDRAKKRAAMDQFFGEQQV